MKLIATSAIVLLATVAVAQKTSFKKDEY
jgi:hypothetical protein